MNKAHSAINWENYPSDETPLNESNLNKMDAAIGVIDDRVITLDTTKATKTEVATLVADVTFEESTGIITITKKNGSKVMIDTQMEKIAINFDYNPTTQQIILTLIDGTKQYIDLSALITQYEFFDSDTVAFYIDKDGKVSAIVKEGSIEEKHLEPNYLAKIKVEVAKAESSQQAAAKSEANAKASENAAKASETAAKTSETNAKASETAAAKSATAAAISETNAKASETSASESSATATEKASSASQSADTAAEKAGQAGLEQRAAADAQPALLLAQQREDREREKIAQKHQRHRRHALRVEKIRAQRHTAEDDGAQDHAEIAEPRRSTFHDSPLLYMNKVNAFIIRVHFLPVKWEKEKTPR